MVEDDGAAVQKDDPEEPAWRGLLGMRERVAMLGGELSPAAGWWRLRRACTPADRSKAA